MIPEKRRVYTGTFDDPSLLGETKVTIDMKIVSVGTELNIAQQGMPEISE